MKHLKFISLFIILSSTLTGCIQSVVSSAVTTTGVAIAQERTIGTAIDDKAIWTQVKHHYLQEDINNLLAPVSVQVQEGRVLLTGTIKNQDVMIQAVKLAWRPKGVKEVINELQVKNKDLTMVATDGFITAHVKSKLLLDVDVRSINYHVETVDGTVYLFGVARTRREHDVVNHLASTAKGVKHVISHIRTVQQADI